MQELMQDVKLIPAGDKDVGTISQLAEVVWNQHYPSLISHSQIDYMLGMMYSKESLAEQMNTKGHQFFLISSGALAVGFISVNREEEEDAWFLNKFYVNQELAAKGIGGKAFDALIAILRPKKISLTVNRQNYKSINFYFKKGFKIEKVIDIEIGNGYVMDDFVMVWESSAADFTDFRI